MGYPANIVVIGSLNMDLVVAAPRIAIEGETIIGGKFSTMPGGKGCNQAVAASRLGANVHLVGCIGDDSFGQALLERLAQENISTEYITVIPDCSSGVALITVSESGENSIVVSPGANEKMTTAHIRQVESIIRMADVLLIQLEIPMEAVQEAVMMASQFQVPIILNPAPASNVSSEVLQRIDVLTPNETEGKLIVTGMVDGDIRAEDTIAALLSQGVQKVVMTLGGDGVAYSQHGDVRRLPAYPVSVVDTTGAGDTFNAGLSVYLAEGKPIDEAVQFAQKAAALSVTGFGAQPSMPYRLQADIFSPIQFK